jgi:concanavalin A-like lectin/glucanase superfamily protein
VNTWVALEPLSATVEAGGEAVVWLRVRNTADIVEEYHIDVVGDPALWCAVEPATLRLYPGTTGSVRLTFAPPRSPDAAAGPHPYGVRVRPVEVPDAVSVPEGNLSVIPFTSIHAELLPVTVRGWRHAKPRLVVDNHGNTTVTVAVLAAAPGNRVDFDIRTPSFQVPPGRAYFSVVKLRPERLLWLGRQVSHSLTTTVQPSGSEPATVQGTYVQSALLPTWMARLGMVLAGLVAAFAALWFLARPTVSSKATAEAATAPTVSAAPQAQNSSPAPAASHTTAAANHPAPVGHASGQPARHERSTVSLPAPVSWWKLNDGSGTTAADATGAHPATGTNIGWCATKTCATFNGTSSFFKTAGPVLNTGPGTSFTVAAWVDMTRIPANGAFATAVSQSATNVSGFFLQYSGADKRWAFARVANDSDTDPGNSYRALSSSAPTLNKWTYLAGVFNGANNQMTLYVNGVAQATVVTDPTPFASNTYFFVIGRGYYQDKPTDWFPGDISNVEAFNTALNSSQVKLLMSRT